MFLKTRCRTVVYWWVTSLQQNVSSLGPVTGVSSHKPLGDVRLQPIQHKNLAPLAHPTYAMLAPTKHTPQGDHPLSPPAPWKTQSSFSLHPQTQPHSLGHPSANPVQFSLDKPVSPVNEYLTPIPRKTSRSPSALDELSTDDQRPSSQLATLKPLNLPREQLSSNSRVPDLNNLKETPIWSQFMSSVVGDRRIFLPNRTV